MFLEKVKSTRGGLSWTKHITGKMRQYGLSEQRLRRVLRNPDRIEEGIAPDTLAIMQKTGTKKNPTEIWLMYQNVKQKTEIKKIKMISAWRYPGISPKRDGAPIPSDILLELKNLINSD
ncbi:MAG: hypothetical protein ABH967_02170 [Patescibacteria group bacterium]